MAPIYLRITINGERVEISANKKVNPENWDKSTERVAGRTEPVRIINTALNNLMGKVDRYFSNLNQRKESGFRKSLEYFERAVNADPDYALAYAGLADAWFLLTWYRYYPGPEGYEKAKEYALQDWIILFRNFEI